ncbi:hypothetical protein LTR74_003932 [Friedmanniomyces endolithicus]|nr:hypothetical protein LTR74_003932 [Friedmanniomyces endolithicus]
MSTSAADHTPTQACDACRRRKLKCDRTLPKCGKCRTGLITCLYNDSVKRKMRTAPSDLTRRQLHASSAQSPASPKSQRRRTAEQPSINATSEPPPASAQFGSPFTVSSSGQWQVGAGSRDAAIPPMQSHHVPGNLLRVHVHLFLRWMLPIWPVVRPATIWQYCTDHEILAPKSYCLLLALCAATNIQLNLAPTDSLFDDDAGDDGIDGVCAPLKKEYFLSAALAVRNKQLDIATAPDLETLLTSSFLFSAYANLDKHDEAWFYLSQTVSFVISLRLNDERTYSFLDAEAAEMRRRIYWHVFILERAYCLHNQRPVTLHAAVAKPALTFHDDPGPVDGFLGIISIFESIPASLYNWLCNPHTEMPRDAVSVPICFWSLSDASLFPVGANETQLVNNSVTQQWLRSYLWHIALKYQLPDTVFMADSLPLEAPLSAAKSVMSTIASVSQRSMEVHGIGMERKLFDLGTYILDYAAARPNVLDRHVAICFSAKEMLWGLLCSLSKLRGAQSFLLPSLLGRAKDFLTLDRPISQELTSDPEDTEGAGGI